MDITPNLHKLIQYIESEDFRGYDPYDALNSPLLRSLSFGSKYGRIAVIQLLKRLPFNLRPLLGIKKEYNPKGLGLFLWGYAKLFKKEQDAEYLKRIDQILDLLWEQRSTGYSGNCWGYNFDWQSRAFYVPKFTPTVVNSSFIGHALLDTYLYTGRQRALDMALPIAEFIARDLNRTEEDGTICLSYTPIDHTVVHNANLLGASLLARLYRFSHNEEHFALAKKCLAYTMRHQSPDGSWPYANTDYQGWIDSFHTGFNLQSIRYFLDEGFAEEFRSGYEKGVEFYQKKFYLEDGTPKYYHDRVLPIDIHSPAQAVVFFSGMGEPYREITDRILRWMIRNMQDPRGYFYFQKKGFYLNKISYIRWGQAWAFHALTEYATMIKSV